MFNLLSSISDTHRKKCLVVGDVVVDCYLHGSVNRMSSEAPIPVVDIQKTTQSIGGAGNVIKNLISLGFEVKALSIVGNDEPGQFVMQSLSELGVEARVRVSSGKTTSKKTRLIAGKAQVARFDLDTSTNEPEDFMEVLKHDFVALVEDTDVVVISDYDRGVLEYNFTRFCIEQAKKLGKPIVCDPRVKDFTKYSGVTVITPNLKEANHSVAKMQNDNDLQNALITLKDKFDIANPCITLSERGISYLDANNKLAIEPAFGGNITDVTGAGDTVVAAMCLAIVHGLSHKNACILANMAASVVVERLGTATTTIAEIKQKFTTTETKNTSKESKESKDACKFVNKIKTTQQMLDIMAGQRDKKWVFTNGCFDIIHTGHLDVISRAKNCGDLLILGLNSDASVKRLKGPSRPVNNEATRASVLAALEFVDFVVVFEEDTPEQIIKTLRPNILAKGIDYIANPQDLPGASYVDKVEILGVKLDSTTEIINRILDKNNN